MIGVEINGRLGNQMFQYAFAYTQSRKHFTLFFLEKTQPKNEDYQLDEYFRLRLGEKYLMRIAKTLYWRWLRKTSHFTKLFQTGENSIESIGEKSKKKAFWEGFFQSETFFQPFEKKIKQLFTVRQKYQDEFWAKYKHIFENNQVLALHIRRTDYRHHGSDKLGGKDLSLPMKYYDNCLNKIGNLDNYYIIILSDDMEFVKTYFADRTNFHFEHNEEIVDFQILQNADISIISNSTFAWWAAYLNKKPPRIYAPKYWLGFHINQEYPKSIMTNKFNWINVNE